MESPTFVQDQLLKARSVSSEAISFKEVLSIAILANASSQTVQLSL